MRTIETKQGARHWLLVAAVSIFIGSSVSPIYAQNAATEQSANVIEFSQAELEQMLAPIALYPDTLLTHILIAATYPIEVIDADRFIKSNSNLSENAIIAKAEDKEWDPSVKALLAFPRILENLSQDLGWMRKLGDAFLQSESSVLASIQSLRQRADDAGNLSQMDNVQIVREKKTIIIEPQQPEVIYVPYYDTRVVYGSWHWSHYPPVYWHRPVHYSYYHGPFYWRSGVHIAFDFFFSAFHWHNHHIVRHHHKKRYYHSNRRIATSHHAKRWHHNPKHRRGVAYHSEKIKHRYVSNRPSVIHTATERKRIKARSHESKTKLTEKKFVSPKHQQLKQRLVLNKAVKVNSNEQTKHRLPKKLNQSEKFYASKENNVERKKLLATTNNKKYSNLRNGEKNNWKAQSKTEFSEKKYQNNSRTILPKKEHDPVRYQKQYSPKEHKKSYRAQGGHSNKSYSRVAKNSSNRTKSTKGRQKHH